MITLKDTLGNDAVLGKTTSYPTKYDKSLLFAVSRQKQRQAMGFANKIFYGIDIWNAYELAFLNVNKKPIRLSLGFHIDARSEFLPESKSVKLYLNSFNNEVFNSANEVLKIIEKDLSEVCNYKVFVYFNDDNLVVNSINEYKCIDDEDVLIKNHNRNPDLLKLEEDNVSERLVTHLFKSHCLCTKQPDWGSIFIEYSGKKINKASLLEYLISFYNHIGFSENCIEQIFVDIMNIAQCDSLVVFGRFLRRGGIDINPYRTSSLTLPINDIRLLWQ